MSYGRVYIVTNQVNGKQYVGQTTVALTRRWAIHLSSARSLRNSCRALGNAIRKYGPDNFTMVEVDSASSKEELDAKELQWVGRCNSISPNGYNLTEGGGSVGRPSEETIEKRRRSLQGHPTPQITRDRIRNAQVGRMFTPEHREKLRQAKLGRKQDPEQAARRIAASRAVWAERRDEIVAKITHAHLGTHHTEATKEKMRASAKTRKRSS
jgi:group I intron endonuclease